MDLSACPECGVPAEVTARRALPSTDGPVEHAGVRCVAGHVFLLPTSMLVTVPSDPATIPPPERLDRRPTGPGRTRR